MNGNQPRQVRNGLVDFDDAAPNGIAQVRSEDDNFTLASFIFSHRGLNYLLLSALNKPETVAMAATSKHPDTTIGRILHGKWDHVHNPLRSNERWFIPSTINCDVP